ncbi:MAG: type II toxin-antitoxin system prevent-host-death family antitoxin [Planctomycetota bacterium]|nr:type II toxin-antitoxin system prevent-host-death family antitoxin [Planctomycetota bacterium]
MPETIPSSTNVVGAYEAKTRLSELLDRVALGEEITISRHGTLIAKLVPLRKASSVESRREAVRKMREIADRNVLSGLTVRELKEEGRR